MAGMVRANLDASSGCKGMVKKQSFRSITVKCQSLGIIVGEGSPGCNGPMSSITILIHLTSYRKHHFQLFFEITNTGEFHGLLVGTMCPTRICSATESFKYRSLSKARGHWSTQTGVFQVNFRVCCVPVALRTNLTQCWHPIVTDNPAPKE